MESRNSEAFLFSHTVGVYRIDLRRYVYISIAVGKYRVDFLIKGNISTICTKHSSDLTKAPLYLSLCKHREIYMGAFMSLCD